MNTRRITIAFMLALIISLGQWNNAWAHADLVKSEPAAGAALITPPSEIRLFFNQAVKKGTTARVLDAQGQQVDNKDGKIDLNDLDHKTFILTVPSLPPGSYTVMWTSVSDDDGDSKDGTFNFAIGSAAQPTATTATTPTAKPTIAPTSIPQATPISATPATLPATGEQQTTGGAFALLAALGAIGLGMLLWRVRAKT